LRAITRCRAQGVGGRYDRHGWPVFELLRERSLGCSLVGVQISVGQSRFHPMV
jgi:hypothetical protein